MSAISIFQLEHTVPNEIPLTMIIEQPFENNPIKMRTQTITKQCINPYRSGNITSYEYINTARRLVIARAYPFLDDSAIEAFSITGRMQRQ